MPWMSGFCVLHWTARHQLDLLNMKVPKGRDAKDRPGLIHGDPARQLLCSGEGVLGQHRPGWCQACAGLHLGLVSVVRAQSVLRAGGLLTTLGARRHVVYATQDAAFNYEAMLALDENNPRRGVRKIVMDQLPTVRALSVAPLPWDLAFLGCNFRSPSNEILGLLQTGQVMAYIEVP